MINDLIFCGDIHGGLRELVWKLGNLEITRSSVVILGDFGVGFGKQGYEDQLYQRVSGKLEKLDIVIYTIRGNHDNPEYFDGLHDYPRLKFLPDWKIIELSGQSILPIGGAVSLDPEWRITENKKYEARGSEKRLWWPDEDIVRVHKDLPVKVDIIISHDAPLSFDPVTIRTSDIPAECWNKAVKSREYLDYILDNVNCRYWYFGHYHKTVTGNFGHVSYKCLDIQELSKFYINDDEV